MERARDHDALLHDSYHLCQQASPNHLSRTAALLSLRGGESSGQVSVLTLLVRVFIPSFQRESEANQGGLDLEGGGLMRRIARLVSGILLKVPGFARRANVNGEQVGRDSDLSPQSPERHIRAFLRLLSCAF